MKRFLIERLIMAARLGACLLAACLLVSMPSSAQTRTPVPASGAAKSGAQKKETVAPTPRMPDGHPDFSGVYFPGPLDPDNYKLAEDDRSNQRYVVPAAEKPSYQPWALEKMKLLGDRSLGNPNLIGACPPPGITGFFFKNRVAVRFLQTPKDLVILTEQETTYRVIYLDGRKHPEPQDVYPLFMGHSVGHWEGETLVVDTIGVDTHTSGGGGGPSFASDVAHYKETFRRPDAKTLLVQFTVDDPKVLTKPWTSPVARYTWAPNRDMEEQFDCMSSRDIEFGLLPPDADKPKLTANGTDEHYFDEEEYQELSKKYNRK